MLDNSNGLMQFSLVLKLKRQKILYKFNIVILNDSNSSFGITMNYIKLNVFLQRLIHYLHKKFINASSINYQNQIVCNSLLYLILYYNCCYRYKYNWYYQRFSYWIIIDKNVPNYRSFQELCETGTLLGAWRFTRQGLKKNYWYIILRRIGIQLDIPVVNRRHDQVLYNSDNFF